jgi:type I restriction enzyme S subunit
MNVKLGYKRTEVGVIPDDWGTSPLLAVADCLDSLRVPLNDAQRQRMQGNIPYCGANGVLDYVDGFVVDDDIILMAEDGGYFDEYALRPIAYRMQGKCWVNNHAHILKAKRSYDQGFLFYSLVHKNILPFLTSGTRAKLNKSEMEKIVIPTPPKHEQRAIAAALSDVDALLDALARLLAKKRDLKQAAMQRLLTGQTRLPDFQGEWPVKRLGELGSFLKGSGVKKDEAKGGVFPCVRYGEIYTDHNDIVRHFRSWITAEVAQKATRLRQGDLLFAGSGETKEEIGKCVAFVDDCEAYAGGDIVILRPSRDVDASFMGYYLNTKPINMQKASKGQGDAVVHISARALSGLQIRVPMREEQAMIAHVLSDMDAEQATLEARLEKTRALKKAMMQELLTGRIRLVTPEHFHA